MARPKKLVTNEECERLNSLRILYSGKGIYARDLFNLFKQELGWTNTATVQKICNEVFIKVDRGVYAFPKIPIYIGKLQNIFDDVAHQRSKIYAEKKHIQTVEPEVVKDPIQDAIKLLKENGYKITKEYFNVSEALKNPNMPASTFIKIEEF